MRIRDAILGSFFGDALSLGPHWIYNPDKIRRLYPDGIQGFDDPKTEYHPAKAAGDFTHYGDQALALLRSMALHGDGWSVEVWRNDWLAWAKTTKAYRDGATKRTQENLEGGVEEPSDSNDLAGASRMAPLLARLKGEELVAAARAQTALTHGDPQVVDAAEFFMRAVLAAGEGAGFSEAFDRAAAVPYEALPAVDWLAAGRAAVEGDLNEKAGELGLTCHVPDAFPLTIALALRFEDAPVSGLGWNAMVGGDSAARGMVLGMLFGARHGLRAFPAEWFDHLKARREIAALLELLEVPEKTTAEAASFPNPIGDRLDAVIDFPAGPVRAFALFAHCFTCGKNLGAARRIAARLAERGIATLRFDFTGLGASGGDFAETSFLTNRDDLVAAADFMRDRLQAPGILIGHSLGGAAVLAAAARIPEVKAVATIGAPSDPEHVTKLFEADLGKILAEGRAEVTLAGRRFGIGARFVEDFAEQCQPCEIEQLKRDLLIFHAPGDEVVGVDHARRIYEAARHPKSFVSLAGADHLLSRPEDADFVAGVLAEWAVRVR